MLLLHGEICEADSRVRGPSAHASAPEKRLLPRRSSNSHEVRCGRSGAISLLNTEVTDQGKAPQLCMLEQAYDEGARKHEVEE